MTRIRYIKKDNLLISKELLMVQQHMCNVIIDINTLQFEVVSVDDDIVLVGGSTSLPNAKMTVKRLLRDLGVRFDDEIRQRINVKKLEVDL